MSDDSKEAFARHVALIKTQDGLSDGTARWRAFIEGEKGYDARTKPENRER